MTRIEPVEKAWALVGMNKMNNKLMDDDRNTLGECWFAIGP
jgi:hypothetical protein